jgi:hypothetical protein
MALSEATDGRPMRPPHGEHTKYLVQKAYGMFHDNRRSARNPLEHSNCAAPDIHGATKAPCVANKFC